jgi:hypothetical protein
VRVDQLELHAFVFHLYIAVFSGFVRYLQVRGSLALMLASLKNYDDRNKNNKVANWVNIGTGSRWNWEYGICSTANGFNRPGQRPGQRRNSSRRELENNSYRQGHHGLS